MTFADFDANSEFENLGGWVRATFTPDDRLECSPLGAFKTGLFGDAADAALILGRHPSRRMAALAVTTAGVGYGEKALVQSKGVLGRTKESEEVFVQHWPWSSIDNYEFLPASEFGGFCLGAVSFDTPQGRQHFAVLNTGSKSAEGFDTTIRRQLGMPGLQTLASDTPPRLLDQGIYLSPVRRDGKRRSYSFPDSTSYQAIVTNTESLQRIQGFHREDELQTVKFSVDESGDGHGENGSHFRFHGTWMIGIDDSNPNICRMHQFVPHEDIVERSQHTLIDKAGMKRRPLVLEPSETVATGSRSRMKVFHGAGLAVP